MNKSFITNFIALLATLAGYFFEQSLLFTVGLFALSGAFTNWIAVHMLFEKVPLLYGSGVIPTRFEDFKIAIKELMMEQFFTEENIDRFLSGSSGGVASLDLAPVIEKIDLNPAFDDLVDVIEKSSFGGMLAMVGGSEALQPLREPFIEKMKVTVGNISQSEEFAHILKDEIEQGSVKADMREKVSEIIDQRLNELTPQLVKEIIQAMIRKHLGWLVVWGGVFGGVIGFIAAVTKTF